jgi:hypothetical protein
MDSMPGICQKDPFFMVYEHVREDRMSWGAERRVVTIVKLHGWELPEYLIEDFKRRGIVLCPGEVNELTEYYTRLSCGGFLFR